MLSDISREKKEDVRTPSWSAPKHSEDDEEDEEHEEYKGQDRYGELAPRDHFVNKSEFRVPFPSCLCRMLQAQGQEDFGVDSFNSHDSIKKGGFRQCYFYYASHAGWLSRLGLTPNLEPAREGRTFLFIGTPSDSLSWNDCIKSRLLLKRGSS